MIAFSNIFFFLFQSLAFELANIPTSISVLFFEKTKEKEKKRQIAIKNCAKLFVGTVWPWEQYKFPFAYLFGFFISAVICFNVIRHHWPKWLRSIFKSDRIKRNWLKFDFDISPSLSLSSVCMRIFLFSFHFQNGNLKLQVKKNYTHQVKHPDLVILSHIDEINIALLVHLVFD